MLSGVRAAGYYQNSKNSQTAAEDRNTALDRHALTPNGWVHEQDNAKVGTKDGQPITFAHETLLNSYVPATDFPIAAADNYWAKTQGYWASVRAD